MLSDFLGSTPISLLLIREGCCLKRYTEDKGLFIFNLHITCGKYSPPSLFRLFTACTSLFQFVAFSVSIWLAK